MKYSVDATPTTAPPTETKAWVKYVPFITTGAGLFFAYKKGGKYKYLTFGALGLGAGVLVSMMASGKNIIDIYKTATKPAEENTEGSDNPMKAKFIIENFSISGKQVNKSGLQQYVMGIPNKDLDIAYRVAKLSVSTKGVLPKEQGDFMKKLQEFNLTKEDYDYFLKNTLPNIMKVAGVK